MYNEKVLQDIKRIMIVVNNKYISLGIFNKQILLYVVLFFIKDVHITNIITVYEKKNINGF